jgi:trk system potassium uptake protein TrkA
MANKQFLVIGLGRFGHALATTLYEQGHDVVAIDASEERVERIADQVTHAAIADACDEEALRRLGVANFDRVIVAIGSDFQASVIATVTSKQLGAKAVTCKATNATMASVLSKVGADEVVRPEHDMGVRLAKQLATPSIVDAFQLGAEHEVIEIEAPPKLTGSLLELKLRNRFGVQVIAVNRSDGLIVSPGPNFEVRRGDRLVLIGSTDQIAELRSFLG